MRSDANQIERLKPDKRLGAEHELIATLPLTSSTVAPIILVRGLAPLCSLTPAPHAAAARASVA
jgi:hypothetical protein